MSEALELAGLALLVLAAWRVSPTLGLAVAGLGLLLLGLAADGVSVRDLLKRRREK